MSCIEFKPKAMIYWRADDVETVMWSDLQHLSDISALTIEVKLLDIGIPPCSAREKHNQDGGESLLLLLQAVATGKS